MSVRGIVQLLHAFQVRSKAGLCAARYRVALGQGPLVIGGDLEGGGCVVASQLLRLSGDKLEPLGSLVLGVGPQPENDNGQGERGRDF